MVVALDMMMARRGISCSSYHEASEFLSMFGRIGASFHPGRRTASGKQSKDKEPGKVQRNNAHDILLSSVSSALESFGGGDGIEHDGLE